MNYKSTPPALTNAPIVLSRALSAYKLWLEYAQIFPKTSRYSLGVRIDDLFCEIIDLICTASYLTKQDKLPYVRKATAKLDVLKVFVQFAWSIQSLDNKKYITLSELLTETGKMLGGWSGQLSKQNSPTLFAGEK